MRGVFHTAPILILALSTVYPYVSSHFFNSFNYPAADRHFLSSAASSALVCSHLCFTDPLKEQQKVSSPPLPSLLSESCNLIAVIWSPVTLTKEKTKPLCFFFKGSTPITLLYSQLKQNKHSTLETQLFFTDRFLSHVYVTDTFQFNFYGMNSPQQQPIQGRQLIEQSAFFQDELYESFLDIRRTPFSPSRTVQEIIHGTQIPGLPSASFVATHLHGRPSLSSSSIFVRPAKNLAADFRGTAQTLTTSRGRGYRGGLPLRGRGGRGRSSRSPSPQPQDQFSLSELKSVLCNNINKAVGNIMPSSKKITPSQIIFKAFSNGLPDDTALMASGPTTFFLHLDAHTNADLVTLLCNGQGLSFSLSREGPTLRHSNWVFEDPSGSEYGPAVAENLTLYLTFGIAPALTQEQQENSPQPEDTPLLWDCTDEQQAGVHLQNITTFLQMAASPSSLDDMHPFVSTRSLCQEISEVWHFSFVRLLASNDSDIPDMNKFALAAQTASLSAYNTLLSHNPIRLPVCTDEQDMELAVISIYISELNPTISQTNSPVQTEEAAEAAALAEKLFNQHSIQLRCQVPLPPEDLLSCWTSSLLDRIASVIQDSANNPRPSTPFSAQAVMESALWNIQTIDMHEVPISANIQIKKPYRVISRHQNGGALAILVSPVNPRIVQFAVSSRGSTKFSISPPSTTFGSTKPLSLFISATGLRVCGSSIPVNVSHTATPQQKARVVEAIGQAISNNSQSSNPPMPQHDTTSDVPPSPSFVSLFKNTPRRVNLPQTPRARLNPMFESQTQPPPTRTAEDTHMGETDTVYPFPAFTSLSPACSLFLPTRHHCYHLITPYFLYVNRRNFKPWRGSLQTWRSPRSSSSLKLHALQWTTTSSGKSWQPVKTDWHTWSRFSLSYKQTWTTQRQPRNFLRPSIPIQPTQPATTTEARGSQTPSWTKRGEPMKQMPNQISLTLSIKMGISELPYEPRPTYHLKEADLLSSRTHRISPPDIPLLCSPHNCSPIQLTYSPVDHDVRHLLLEGNIDHYLCYPHYTSPSVPPLRPMNKSHLISLSNCSPDSCSPMNWGTRMRLVQYNVSIPDNLSRGTYPQQPKLEPFDIKTFNITEKLDTLNTKFVSVLNFVMTLQWSYIISPDKLRFNIIPPKTNWIFHSLAANISDIDTLPPEFCILLHFAHSFIWCVTALYWLLPLPPRRKLKIRIPRRLLSHSHPQTRLHKEKQMENTSTCTQLQLYYLQIIALWHTATKYRRRPPPLTTSSPPVSSWLNTIPDRFGSFCAPPITTPWPKRGKLLPNWLPRPIHPIFYPTKRFVVISKKAWLLCKLEARYTELRYMTLLLNLWIRHSPLLPLDPDTSPLQPPVFPTFIKDKIDTLNLYSLLSPFLHILGRGIHAGILNTINDPRAIILALLLMAGDIHPNPGPPPASPSLLHAIQTMSPPELTD